MTEDTTALRVETTESAFNLLAVLHREEANIAAANIKLPATVIAQIILQYLPKENARMSLTDKAFWTEMAHELGPDWISEFRRAGDFMDKVDEF